MSDHGGLYSQGDRGRGHTRPSMNRSSSVIIPSTGLRIHRSVSNLPRNYTLRSEPRESGSTTGIDDEDVSDTTPLLGGGSTRPPRRAPLLRRLKRMGAHWLASANSKTGRKVIKCSLAYFLGSLATFVTPISAFLGKYDGKHMVATCAVYFHPARSAGNMHEATFFALAAFLYSTIVSVGGMGISLLFNQQELIALGHAIVLIVFCAGGLGLIGYTKIAMSSPTVSVACSLASIAIITIFTKEGCIQIGDFSMGKIYQVSTIVIMSIVISNFLAFTLWPTSAISELRQLMIQSTDSFSAMLTIISRSFLNGSENELLGDTFKKATTNHRTVFTSLIKNLSEAKYEHYLWGTEQEYHIEKEIIECMQRLAQHIGGLRSAASTQFTLLATAQEHQMTARPSGGVAIIPHGETTDGPQLFTPPGHSGIATPIRFGSVSATVSAADSAAVSTAVSEDESDGGSMQEDPIVPITIFDQFIYHLGPPMKSLAYTLKLMLDDLPSAPGQAYNIRVNREFRGSLGQAIALFSETRIEALNTLYKSEAVTKERRMTEAADVEEIAASCGYFSYCLLYFAEEMLVFLCLLEQLEDLQARRPRTWEWAKFWKSSKNRETERAVLQTNNANNFALKRAKTIPNVAPEAGVPFSFKIWKALSMFRQRNVRFSIKVGVGAALYALPAFIPQTRPIYSHWRGEWGLVSYMIVMSMTLGQTNNSGKARVFGTVVGSILALFAWFVFSTNPYTLSIFGWAVSIPCFWIILTWKQATFGRFILLTYNLSVLYAYSLATADTDGDDADEGGTDPIITEIVLHRFVAVTVGVLWSMFITLAIWPTSARNQLRNGLSVLWLRMALIWRRDPLLSLIEGESREKYLNITEEHALQSALLRLGRLTDSAPHEFRLKGPFPSEDYKNLLTVNQAILDAFHGMSVMITKDPKANRREAEILEHTQREREDLCARISHLFYVLASSMKLGFPLPGSLPKTDRARDRLLAKLFEFRKRVRGTEGDSDEDFALIYAYALVTGKISEGLLDAIATVERLYGVLEDEMLEI